MQAARRPWHLALYVLALAMLVALVAAVSSWAAGDPAPAQQTTTPIQHQAPENGNQAPEGEGSDRPPCPDGEEGGSSQQQGQGSDSTV